MNDSAKAVNLGRWFPPWAATREVWHKEPKPHVSGVSTDAVLFSENGSQLVHHYRVFGQSVAHASLHGKFMAGLQLFTVQAFANAKWASKRDQVQETRSLTSSGSPTPLPRSIRSRRSDNESPAFKAPRLVSPVIP